MIFYSVVTGLTAVLFFFTGLFVYSQNVKSYLYRRCFIFSSAVSLWAIGYFLTLVGRFGFSIMLACSRLSHAFGAFIPIAYLHFVWVLLKKKEDRPFFIVGYLFSLFMFGMCLTPLVVKTLLPKMGIPYYPEWGVLYPVYAGMFLAFPGYAQLELAKAIRHSTGTERTRLLYFFVALGLAFGGGISLFLLIFNVPFPPYLSVLIILYPPMMAYTILVHKFMDIEAVINKTLVYSILAASNTFLYLIIVWFLERLFQTAIGYESLHATILALLTIAVFFQPLKNRIQRFVDFRFFRGTLESLADEKQRLEDEIRRTDQLRIAGTLASSLAHEIKNPLTSIKTFTKYLPERKNEGGFIEKFQEVVGNEVDRIEKLTKDLLDFTKPRPPLFEELDVHKILDKTLGLIEHDLTMSNIKPIRSYCKL